MIRQIATHQEVAADGQTLHVIRPRVVETHSLRNSAYVVYTYNIDWKSSSIFNLLPFQCEPKRTATPRTFTSPLQIYRAPGAKSGVFQVLHF